MVMIGGGIAHTAYGGVGLGYLLGFPPIIGAFIISILAAFGIGFAKRHGRVQTDVLIALFWSLGMALGIAFIGMMPGYPPDMTSYLFGNILSVTRSELILMFALTILVVFVVVMFSQQQVAGGRRTAGYDIFAPVGRVQFRKTDGGHDESFLASSVDVREHDE